MYLSCKWRKKVGKLLVHDDRNSQQLVHTQYANIKYVLFSFDSVVVVAAVTMLLCIRIWYMLLLGLSTIIHTIYIHNYVCFPIQRVWPMDITNAQLLSHNAILIEIYDKHCVHCVFPPVNSLQWYFVTQAGSTNINRMFIDKFNFIKLEFGPLSSYLSCIH